MYIATGLWTLGLLSGLWAQDRPKVLATTTFLADMAHNVAGELAEVHSLMPVGGDPHIYDPVPEDARKVVEADLILKNGLHLEGWLDEMLENAGTQAPIISLTDGIPAIQSEDHPDSYDPHAWMNVRFGLRYVENIKRALEDLMPEHAEQLEANYQQYRQRLIELDRYIVEKIQTIPEGKRILITSHDAFRYYGQRYGLQVESVIGTSTDAEVRIQDVKDLMEVIEAQGVPAVFIESTINPKQLRQMAGDKGIVIGGKLFADSLGDEESGADTYEDMLRQNTDLIVQALTRARAAGKAGEGPDFSSLLIIFMGLAAAFAFMWWRLRSRDLEGISWEGYSLDIRGLSVSYDRKTALSNVYLSIPSGRVSGLIGGNGSGKSTLIKSILGIIEPDAGQISLNGLEIESIRKYIAYIPQKEEIDWSFPATVLDVAMMGRYPHRQVFEKLQTSDRKKAVAALRQLGIEELKNKQIGELSGGQQQRAFIARALCQEAEVYLFDEPFVGVDITTEQKIMEVVKELAREGKLVMIIHHDLAKVEEYFDHLIMINQRVVAAGPTSEVFNDENIRKTYGGQLTMLQKTESFK
jgi:ABC-type Mn2+/Zn2+ transport system ATPase subunit/ABC-type Zn uptake system ZnuABC Zn-binding protein ZnuA